MLRRRSTELVAGILTFLGSVPGSLGQQELTPEKPPSAVASETKPKTAPAEGWSPSFALPGPCPVADGDAADLSRPELSIDKYHANPPLGPGPDCCWHFIGEGGFLFIQPYFSHNPAFTIGHAQGTAQTQDFDYRGHFAPWVTLGVVNSNGWGLRASWWYYNQSDETPFLANRDSTGRTTIVSAPIEGIPGFRSPSTVTQNIGVLADTVDFNDHLRLDVYDWEGLRDFHGDRWSLLLSGGVRYGYLSQRYDAYRFNTGTGRTGTTTVVVREDSDTATSGRQFAGVGPTGALEAGLRLGCGFGLYGIARGSVLFGRDKMQSFQRTVTTLQITPAGGSSRTTSSSVAFEGPGLSRDETLPLADFEIGLSWTRPYRGASLFLRVGLADENWFGAGAATADHGDLGFFGMRFAAGITY
jgi:hypothetical protein